MLHYNTLNVITYRYMGWKSLICYLLNFAHEIHCSCCTLQRINSVMVQNLKCKYGLGHFNTSQEKLCMKEQLHILI